jgi:hypothetical protein
MTCVNEKCTVSLYTLPVSRRTPKPLYGGKGVKPFLHGSSLILHRLQ